MPVGESLCPDTHMYVHMYATMQALIHVQTDGQIKNIMPLDHLLDGWRHKTSATDYFYYYYHYYF